MDPNAYSKRIKKQQEELSEKRHSLKIPLNETYSRIPKFTCIEGCTDCCVGRIDTNPEEEKRIGKKIELDKDGKCEFVIDGSCSIYEKRPFICRLFGTTDRNLPVNKCEHGCGPIFPLSEYKSLELFTDYHFSDLHIRNPSFAKYLLKKYPPKKS